MPRLQIVAFGLFAQLAFPAFAANLPNFDARSGAPAEHVRIDERGLPPALVTSRDASRGVPTFLLAPRSRALAGSPALSSPQSAARYFLAEHAGRYGLSPAALENAQVERVADLGRGGIVVTFQQRVNGVEVFHSDAKVLLDRDLRLVAISGALHPAAVSGGKLGSFKLADGDAAVAALRDVYGGAVAASALSRVERSQAGWSFFTLNGASGGLRAIEPLRVKRVLFPLPQRLVAAYFVELVVQSGTAPSDAYALVIDAVDGRLLYRENLTHAAFSYRVFADATGDKRPFDGPLADVTPDPGGAPNGSYPGFVSPNLVTMDGFNAPHDPWLAPGATQSVGNNVDAYTDDDNPDGFSANDLRATVSSSGVFDYTFDPLLDPQANNTQKMAAVTDLFYVTNWLHDWWYDSGFTEAAGNAQQDNYGRGGVGGDPLHAEAQDGAPTTRNNSNMQVPSDGSSPRMQMYVWDGRTSASLTVQPGNTTYAVGVGGFGPPNFNVSGTVVQVNDGSGTVTDACQAITNNISGQVALVDRGSCTFESKALRVQQAGGIGMILVDNQTSTTPPSMGSDSSITQPITIGVLSVTLSDGTAIRSALSSGTVTASLARASAVTADGTIDNTVVAHEWGHYLHLRQVACGNLQCQAQSEGWGDFTALQMVVRQGDDLNGTFALAQYAAGALSGDPAYFGIRRYPYSVDQTKNPLTFKDITQNQALPSGIPLNGNAAGSDNNEVHNAGEVWAAMLFEGFVALLHDAQGGSARYTFDEARRRMSDYVELGLQLAPADPTYTEQRDAVIAAAAASDAQDGLLLAQAFARRGAGTCAVSPARDSSDFSGVVEDFTVSASVQITGATLDDAVASCDHDGVLDASERGHLNVTLVNSGAQPWSGTVTASTAASGVTFPNGGSATITSVGAGQQTIAAIEVALDPSVTGVQILPFQLALSPAASCADGGAVQLPIAANFDVALQGATTDDVEAPVSAWTPEGTNADVIWSRQMDPDGGHAWLGVDYPSPSDTALVSPPLQVSATDAFGFTFAARYRFEQSQNVNWDGAVIELSTDDGGSWSDVTQFGANPGYGGMIGDPQNQATNVLKGRQGYVGANASWPGRDTYAVDLGTALAGQTVKVRFRIGSDDSTGEYGWELDDLAFHGLLNQPFTSLQPNAGVCTAPVDAGPADGGSEQVDAGTSSGSTGSSGTSSTTGATGSSGSGTGASSGSTGGESGTSSTGSTTGHTGGATTGGGAPDAGSGSKAAGGGCGCGSDPASPGLAAPMLAFALAWLARKRMRA